MSLAGALDVGVLEPQGLTICRVPGCRTPAFNYRHRLCEKHYNRAKERRRLTNGALSFDALVNQPELLNGDHTRILRVPSQDPASRSCIGCQHLSTVKAFTAFACAKNQWGTQKYISIDTTEHGGLPPHLMGRARTCPYYSPRPLPSSTPGRTRT